VSFAVGVAITAALILTAALSLVYTPRNPLEMSITARLEAPPGAQPFGTDQYGRDLLSRVMAGAATSIVVGVIAVTIGAGIVVAVAREIFRAVFALLGALGWFSLPRMRGTGAIHLFVLAMLALALFLSASVDIAVLNFDIQRMNTVFKFYLQVWSLFAVSAGAAVANEPMARISRSIDSTTTALATAPPACPPMPSAITISPMSGASRWLSSLALRTSPTCVRATIGIAVALGCAPFCVIANPAQRRSA
jgi:hypothetical protein